MTLHAPPIKNPTRKSKPELTVTSFGDTEMKTWLGQFLLDQRTALSNQLVAKHAKILCYQRRIKYSAIIMNLGAIVNACLEKDYFYWTSLYYVTRNINSKLVDLKTNVRKCGLRVEKTLVLDSVFSLHPINACCRFIVFEHSSFSELQNSSVINPNKDNIT